MRMRSSSMGRVSGAQGPIHVLTERSNTLRNRLPVYSPVEFGSRERSQRHADRGPQAHGGGHGITRSPDRAVDRTHPGAHRAPEDARQGPPLTPRPPSPGRQATATAQLPEGHRRGALPRPRRQARDQEIKPGGSHAGSAGSALRSSRSSAHLRGSCEESGQESHGRVPPTYLEVFGVAVVTKTVDVAGRRISIETGRVAEQANGAVIIRQGDTVVLSTAVMSKEPREGIDFFPLTCDYEEKLYAAGKIPGAFMRREGRPSETAILASRLTDRPLRPLFPEGFRLDIQVISTVLSVDQENDPTILSINGASTALTISDIPFQGPVGAVRMGYMNGEVVVNPPMSQMGDSELDLVVAGTADAILMVEAGAKGVSEQIVLDALAAAHDAIKQICAAQLELQQQVGLEKREWISATYPEHMLEIVGEYLALRLDQVLYSADKQTRENGLDELRGRAILELGERFPDYADIIGKLFDKALKDRVRQRVVEEGVRVDGRGLKDVRPITVEVGVLPRPHGSGLFTRGQTQALTIATLGSMSDQQKLDGLTAEEFKRYMHHYNFPPYSVGEARPQRGPGRREIGHGALAERALLGVVPPVEDFPFTIRLVSEILSSNRSTSMVSVCGSTLAVMG